MNGVGIRMISKVILLITGLLAPFYFLLSLVATLSRYDNFLTVLSSHGKTSTAIVCTSTSCTSTTSATANTVIATAANSNNASNAITTNISLSSLVSPSVLWISKRYFSHFYLTGLLSNGIIYYCYSCFHPHHYQGQQQHGSDNHNEGSSGDRIPNNYVNDVSIVLLTIHLLRRLYECLFVQQHCKVSSKMHVAGYALGVVYYLVLPIVFLDLGNIDTGTSGNNNNDHDHDSSGLHISSIQIDDDKQNKTTLLSSAHSSFTSLSYLVYCVSGIVVLINLWFQYEQSMHHVILANIRRKGPQRSVQEASTASVIRIGTNNTDTYTTKNNKQYYRLPPKTRWFRHVLCPHYLAEIMIYFTFAIIIELSMIRIIIPNQIYPSNCFYHYLWNSKHIPASTILNDNLVVTACFILLSWGRRYRHWALFFWVFVNLTVSARNNYDWYHSESSNTLVMRNDGDDDDNNYNHKKDDDCINDNDDTKKYQNATREKTTNTIQVSVYTDTDNRTALFPKFW